MVKMLVYWENDGVELDATPFFEQASDDFLIRLAEEQFADSHEIDEVVEFFSDRLFWTPQKDTQP